MNQLARLLLLIAAVVPLVSCDYDDYDVELNPDGSVIERVLTCVRMGDAAQTPAPPVGTAVATTKGPVPQALRPETVEHLNTVYGKPGLADGQKLVYRDRFRHETPNDVGGAGRYEFFDSPMGSLSSYAERFRGNPDVAGRIGQMQAAADRITNHLIGWMGGELKSQPGWPALRKCLDQNVRNDLKTLGVYAWLGFGCDKEIKDPPQMAVRAALYLAERGYWSPEQAPTIAGLASDGSESQVRPALELLRRWVAGQMGVPATQPIPHSLDFLGSPETIQKSLASYLSTTKDYHDLLDRWHEAQKQQPQPNRPEPMQVMEDAASAMLASNPDLQSEPNDHIKVRLACGIKPFRANGEWDAASNTISWSDTLPAASALPMQCYAFWSKPDDRYQVAHFGKIVLQGEPLALYTLGYHGMAAARRNEWDHFVESLHPNPKLVEQLKAFRFSDEPPTTQPVGAGKTPGSVTEPIVDTIVQELSGKQ